MIDLCSLNALCKRKALDLVQKVLDRLCDSTKAAHDDILVEAGPARAWSSITKSVDQMAVRHKIFAHEIWLVYEWGRAVSSLKIERTVSTEYEFIFAIADGV